MFHEILIKYNVIILVSMTVLTQIIKSFLPRMLARDRGHIVAISSMLAIDGITGTADYSASKAAVLRLMDSLRMELYVLHKDHIHTTSVCPFVVDTGFFGGCHPRYDRLELLVLIIFELVLWNMYVLLSHGLRLLMYLQYTLN